MCLAYIFGQVFSLDPYCSRYQSSVPWAYTRTISIFSHNLRTHPRAPFLVPCSVQTTLFHWQLAELRNSLPLRSLLLLRSLILLWVAGHQSACPAASRPQGFLLFSPQLLPRLDGHMCLDHSMWLYRDPFISSHDDLSPTPASCKYLWTASLFLVSWLKTLALSLCYSS